MFLYLLLLFLDIISSSINVSSRSGRRAVKSKCGYEKQVTKPCLKSCPCESCETDVDVIGGIGEDYAYGEPLCYRIVGNCYSQLSPTAPNAPTKRCQKGCPCLHCEDKMKVYPWSTEPWYAKPGETFSPDGCNVCFCTTKGKAECTKQKCDLCQKGKPCDKCIDGKGRKRKVGEFYSSNGFYYTRSSGALRAPSF